MHAAPLIPPPRTWAEWQARRADVRAACAALLGTLPPPIAPLVHTPAVQTHTHDMDETGTVMIERFAFDNGAGDTVTGLVLVPAHALAEQREPAPAVLYHHIHGHQYALGADEAITPRITAEHGGPPIAPGIALAQAGYIVMAIDAYGFGRRMRPTGVGAPEPGPETEAALFKHFLWHGATLWGMMTRDDQLALSLLAARPDVDAGRIAAVGMSLGGTRTTWLAALDDRVRAAVPVAQMTRARDFAHAGRYGLHGIYYYLPGAAVAPVQMEHLVALAAPRPQAVLIGDEDPLSPMPGVNAVFAYAGGVYRLAAEAAGVPGGAPAAFWPRVYPGVGHRFTHAMLSDLIAFLRDRL